MHRWDIINLFIKKNNYKSYLEIGYYKGWSFDNVNCTVKIATDPNPCKTEEQQNTLYGLTIDGKPRELIYKKTSDDFFTTVDIGQEKNPPKWDIIFIDGLHEATQVSRDIENALKHLSPGGTIVLHDCNPPTLEHSTTGDCGGNWNGDVYKAFIKARIELPFLMYTIDTDWGVGVIRPDIPAEKLNWPIDEINYDALEDNREEILNIISVEEFIKQNHEETKDHNVSA